MVRPRKDQQIDIPALAIAEAERLVEVRHNVNFSLAELAQNIGCSAPALYNHFASKGELLQRLRAAGFQRFLSEFLAPVAARKGTSIERMRRGALAYVRFGVAHPSLYRLMFAPASEWAGQLAPCDDDTPSSPRFPSFDLLAGLVMDLQAEGYLRKGDAKAKALVIWAGLHGIVDLAAQNDGPAAGHNVEKMVRQFLDIMLRSA